MYIGWKKIMIMIVFFTLCKCFFYLTLSENIWKLRLKKNMYKAWKKTHALTVKIMYKGWFLFNFSRMGAFWLIKKYTIFRPNTWRFLGGGGGCLGMGFLFNTPPQWYARSMFDYCKFVNWRASYFVYA